MLESGQLPTFIYRHPGGGRDLAGAVNREGEIPAFAGMTNDW